MRPNLLSELLTEVCRRSDDIRFLVYPAIEGGRQNRPPDLSYPATQALWYLLGTLRTRWQPFSVHHDERKRYFLQHRAGNVVLDPTNFESASSPVYGEGAEDLFLTSWPCGRAFKIIERAGFEWPLDAGESICPHCGGSGEGTSAFCGSCGLFAPCERCGGTGIRRVRSAIRL